MSARLLVIRFSSFGDIVQAVAVPQAFKNAFANSHVDWLVREDFAELLRNQPSIDEVIPFARKLGLSGLIQLCWKLARSGQYTHVYDAHTNVRSRFVLITFFIAGLVGLLRGRSFPSFAIRSKDRARRFLFFKFRANTLPQPFRGAESFHRPLAKWGLPANVPAGKQFFLRSDLRLPEDVSVELAALKQKPVIALAPSAAWEMKRWPIEYWKDLIGLLPNASFLLLGGPADDFISEIKALAPGRSVNLSGRLSLDQSSAILEHADLVIANDTGLLHVADQMERPTIALIGPTAFGYPSHKTSVTLEVKLTCQPCSKDGSGKCVNTVYKRCLKELTPDFVAAEARRLT